MKNSRKKRHGTIGLTIMYLIVGLGITAGWLATNVSTAGSLGITAAMLLVPMITHLMISSSP